MFRALLSGIILFWLCDRTLAQSSEFFTDSIHTVVGLLIAARFAFLAFDKRITVDDEPTFPKYMTSRSHYWIGCVLFVIFACLFFVIIVLEHRDVVRLVSLLNGILPVSVTEINKEIMQAIEKQTTTYLMMIVIAMGVVYLYVLKTESQWNILLLVRNMIHHWISIPQLTGQIITLTINSLCVPKDAIQKSRTTS
jgi:hypothetical protein